MKIGKDKTTAVDPLMPADNTEYHFGVVPDKTVDPDNDDGVWINEVRAMVYLPENAVEVELNAKVWHDGEIVSVKKTLEMNDVREAIQKAIDGYSEDDDTYIPTEKGLAWLEEMLKE